MMSNKKDAEIKSRYEDYSVEDLRAVLDAICDSTDDYSDSDLEQMDAIMAVLNKKNPLPQRYTAEESWMHFQENYREELSRLGVLHSEEVMEEEPEEMAAPVIAADIMPSASRTRQTHAEVANAEAKHGNRFRKVLHTALIAAAVVAVMVIVTVSAAAAGIDIWKWVQVRGEGTVRFVAEDALSKDIPAALKQAGVEVPLFPTWIPEGFLLYDQQIKLKDSIHINSTYVCKNRVLLISIRSLNDHYSSIIEIEDESPQEYLSNGIVHYIISNCNELVAYWENNGFQMSISGNLSSEEIKLIIDSVYDEGKK